MSTNLPLIIYQNTYFTESLISIIEQGLTDNEKSKQTSENNKGVSGEVKAGNESWLNALLPFFGYLKGKGDLNFSDFNSVEQDKKITDSFRFSKIEKHLNNTDNENKLKELNEEKDFDNLEIGDFVKFTSSYKKNQIREILDLILNENSFELLWRIYKKNIESTESTEDNNKKNGSKNNKKDGSKNNKKEIKELFDHTKEILKEEFPTENASLDFYGEIDGVDIKNILICDTKFFVQEDKNRILDGKFKVFGKIIDIQQEKQEENTKDSVEKFFSQLDRNKFFKRTTNEGMQKFQQFISDIIDRINQDGKFFNSDFEFIIKGKSLKVLPIVIYT